VGVVTVLQVERLRNRGSFPGRDTDSCRPKTCGLDLWPTQPPGQWVPGVLFTGLKWPGHDGKQSPLSSADIKNEWSYTLTPPYVCMACIGQIYLYLCGCGRNR
jgi:hypothetical protein